MENEVRTIKCEGRFNELTGELNTALDLVLSPEERLGSTVSCSSLNSADGLIADRLEALDAKDPYFQSNMDILRPNTLRIDGEAYMDLVPLVSRIYKLEDQLAKKYAVRLGAEGRIADVLGSWNKGLDLESMLGLGLDSKLIAIKKETVKDHEKSKKGHEQPIKLSPEKASLKGYSLKTKFGIGRTDSDAVVPDAPYSIELYDPDKRLSLLVGFWYKSDPMEKKDIMVISQIQQPQKAQLPGDEKDPQMGIVGMEIAELVARQMGFGAIETYSADRHPMFMQFPDRKPRMKGEFTGYYDSSAKALGFTGTRSTYYKKVL